MLYKSLLELNLQKSGEKLAPTEKIRVLLVEDNPADACIISDMLDADEKHGYILETVEHVETALGNVQKSAPDIILLDLNLPDSSSLDTLLFLNKHCQQVPVVVLTSSHDDNHGLTSLRYGAQDFLVKQSLEKHLLVKTIFYAMERKRLMEDLRTTNDLLQEANHSLESMAFTDSLTNLLNRRGLERAMAREYVRATREGLPLIALFIDLDDFKKVNDHLGHAVGDVVLRDCAEKIMHVTRATDIQARLGGDEFIVILSQTKFSEAMCVAEKVRMAISEPCMKLKGGPISVTASIGISKLENPCFSVQSLLEEVKDSLKSSKEDGKNRVSSNGEDRMLKPQSDVHPAAAVLNAAYQNNSIRSLKHPIVRFRDNTIVGYEFLSRLDVKNFEMPDDFFKVCEESHLLRTMDHLCLKNGFTHALKHAEKGFMCHLNIFPATLMDFPAEYLMTELPEKFPLKNVCIEISEQQIFGNMSELKESVHAFRKRGVKIAVDDVGFGRSSLESLIYLEPDIIKIDKKFVMGISQDAGLRRSLKRLIQVCQGLQARIVAEGIETIEDLEIVKSFGVEYGQGFYWGKPE